MKNCTRSVSDCNARRSSVVTDSDIEQIVASSWRIASWMSYQLCSGPSFQLTIPSEVRAGTLGPCPTIRTQPRLARSTGIVW